MPAGRSYSFVTTSGPFLRRYSLGVSLPRRARISSAHRCRIRPTTMQVREATVGPLSGTTPVSAAFTSMQSYGRPSVSATICACIVRVP